MMRVCGAWIGIFFVLCSKTYSCLFWTPADSRRAARGARISETRVFTVVKRTRVPAGSLVKMATDVDVDSGRKRALIQSVGAYTRNVLFGKIRGSFRNIQCKTRLGGTFHRCTIALRKIFLTRVLRVYDLSVSRVPVFFHEGTWHIYEGTCVVRG